MPRRYWLLISAFLSACAGRRPVPGDLLLPERVADDWKRVRLGDHPPERAPEIVRQLGLERAHTASYAGAGEIDVTLYEMKAPAVAFELAQKWRPEAGTVFFYQGPYFALVRWHGGDRERNGAFIRGLEASLKKLAG